MYQVKPAIAFSFGWTSRKPGRSVCVLPVSMGKWMKEPAKDWFVLIPELDAALEDAFATVLGWMVPSERYFPPGVKP